MNWRCRLGLHCWEEVDTTVEWEKFRKEHGYEGLRIAMSRMNYILWDKFCSRCGKLDLEDLEANKQVVLHHEARSKYAYKNGKVVKI